MTDPGAAETPAALGRAAATAAGARVLQLIVGFAVLAVVGRLIGAEGFGLVAMALLVVAIGDIVVGGGLTEGLVQRQDATRGHENASFWCVLAAGILLAGAMVAGRHVIAGLFGQPELAAIIPPLALVLPITALGAVPLARLQRALRFTAVAGLETAAATAGGMLCIALAVLGHGVWSLVFAELLRVTVRTFGLLYLAGWRPDGLGGIAHLADLFVFNAGVLGARSLGVIDKMLPRALIGVLLGSEALGFYVVAWRLYEQINAVLLTPLNTLALPLAARWQANTAALTALLARAIRLTTTLAFPAYLGLAAIAPLLVPAMLGPGWHPAILLVQIMLMLGVRSAMTSFNNGVLRGLGRPDLQVATMLVGAALTVIVVPLAAPFGLVAVTIAVVARRFATWPLSARHVARLTGFDWRAQSRLAAPNLVAAIVMAGCVWAAQWWLHPTMPVPLLLALCVLLGLVLYPAVLAVIAPRSLDEARARLFAAAGRARGRLFRPHHVAPRQP
jgi:PST family polysaccharide transporter